MQGDSYLLAISFIAKRHKKWYIQEIIGMFGQAIIALTHWVKEASIFILIRAAHALAK